MSVILEHWTGFVTDISEDKEYITVELRSLFTDDRIGADILTTSFEKSIDTICVGMYIDWKIYEDETSDISFPSYGKWTKEELESAKNVEKNNMIYSR